jgi:hypothetical protein
MGNSADWLMACGQAPSAGSVVQYLGGAAMGQTGTTGIFDGPGFLVTDTIPDISPGDIIVFAQATGSSSNRTLTQYNSNVIETFPELYSNYTEDTNLAGYIMLVPNPVPNPFYVTAGPSGSVADGQTFCFMAFRGVDNANPLATPVWTTTDTRSASEITSASPYAASMSEGDMVVKIGAGAHTRGPLFSYELYHDRSPDTVGFFTAAASDTNDSVIGIACIPYQPAFGSQVAPRFNFSGTDSTGYSSASYIFALKPA